MSDKSLDVDKSAYLPFSVIRKYSSGIDNHIKSHDLVFANLKLTPKMCDVLAMLFTKMRAEDWFVEGDLSSSKPAQPRYIFAINEISEFFGCEKRHVASILKKPAMNLQKTVVGIERGNGDFKYTSLFASISYEKGTLTIVPNNELRESYISKAKSKGYALINNKQYLALKDAHSKKTLDLLSRFKTGQKLFPMSIKKLQYIYGVFGQNGEVLIPTYQSPKTFLRRVISDSLKAIADCPESRERIEIQTSEKDGTLGYEIESGDGEDTRIRFLYRWTACFSDEDIEEARANIEKLLTENRKRLDEGFDSPALKIDELRALESSLEIVMSESEEDQQLFESLLVKVREEIEKVTAILEDYENEQREKVSGSIQDLAKSFL
ncbi:hypothetical protein VSAK1_26640 [Vibrio mediterranei AK1]|uniref:replication initiation protein n=1 Tax=Vibrio mediterranei TaxID=689 RepID=UPI0001542B7A|nr:replication initiation protein [Vibrio mediterranei]EDL52206.1 hypothetical protein VSAK1_26640 [Vibrio mediterranei AK1]